MWVQALWLSAPRLACEKPRQQFVPLLACYMQTYVRLNNAVLVVLQKRPKKDRSKKSSDMLPELTTAQRIQKDYAQRRKEAKSGLFHNEQVLTVSKDGDCHHTGAVPPDEEIDIDVDILS